MPRRPPNAVKFGQRMPVGSTSKLDRTHPLHQTRRCVSAGVTQLVEYQPSKLNVAGSNPVSRFTPIPPG